MDRKEFLAAAARLGAGCCGLALLGETRPAAACGAAQTPTALPMTPDRRKVEWAKLWTRRFFDVLDQELDEPTRRRVMEHNGSACYEASLNGKTPPRVMTLEQFVKSVAERQGAGSIRREGDVLHFTYAAGSKEAPAAGASCLCPLVEDGPPGLSGTFCSCSVGYVRRMVEAALGRRATVDLLESVKRGGRACRFRIQVREA